MEIDQVNHVKRFDYYSKDIKQILEKNIIYSETGGSRHGFLEKKNRSQGIMRNNQ
jgi:hypothetical protein